MSEFGFYDVKYQFFLPILLPQPGKTFLKKWSPCVLISVIDDEKCGTDEKGCEMAQGERTCSQDCTLGKKYMLLIWSGLLEREPEYVTVKILINAHNKHPPPNLD